jgi:glycosyltransferase involved in cell wall biosynthesis
MAGVLVHEWISQAGGSENVLEAFSNIYPDADIHCLWNDSVNRFDPSRLHETWLAKTPFRRSKALALPLMPTVWRGLKGDDYDWALISSHLFAHHAHFSDQKPGFPRFVYVHTPARYIWNPELDLRGNSAAVKLLAAAFKPIDRRRANEPASYAANSMFVSQRITEAWDVESQVIYPPVNVEKIQSVDDWTALVTGQEIAALEALPEQFVLGASRFIPYKRLDLVIRAGELAGLPVVLAGNGPELESLKALGEAASVPVHFVIAPSAELLYSLYQRATVYVFPAVEDFGIMPVEAMAAGAPVVAQAIGGSAESVVAGKTGALVTFESETDVREAIDIALGMTRAASRERAQDFTLGRFGREITGWVGA